MVNFFALELNQQAILFVGLATTSTPVLGGKCLFFVDQVSTLAPFAVENQVTTFAFGVPDIPALAGIAVTLQVAVTNGLAFPVPFNLSPALVISL